MTIFCYILEKQVKYLSQLSVSKSKIGNSNGYITLNKGDKSIRPRVTGNTTLNW